ncbi:MAG: YtxH domain-containing protein [Clostridia bacterium]|jgi:gas vesicle protein
MKSKYLRGFIAGSMLGMTAGMFLLPQISSETRRKIINKSKDMLHNYTGLKAEDQIE